jgi:predicted RecA/RadA family phage recombinase
LTYITNAGKNVQNVSDVVGKVPILDANNQAYCGYKTGVFTITNMATGFDGTVFVLKQKAVEAKASGSITEITYSSARNSGHACNSGPP